MASDTTFTDPYLEDIHRIVRRGGVAVQSVLGDTPAGSWSYTIGLTEHGLPELLTIGLPPHVASHALRAAADVAIAQGELPVGRVPELPIDRVGVCFQPVPVDRWNDDLVFGAVMSYYGTLGRAPVSTGLQLVWPDPMDPRHPFPWDDHCDDEVRAMQPILADGARIAPSHGGHPDCVECQKALRAQQRKATARARKRRRARKDRRR
jgi:hypothetical protein